MSASFASEHVVRRAIAGYVSAWNEDDPDALARTLEACWAADGVILSNAETIEGRDGLFRRIRDFRRERPGERGLLLGEPEIHHGWFRFHAVVQRPDGARYSHALDIGEVGADGRIVRIVTFFGAASEGAAP